MIKKLLLPLTALVLALNIQIGKAQCNFSIAEDISDMSHTNITQVITCNEYNVKYTIINKGSSLPCPVKFAINLPIEITLDSTGFTYYSSNGDTLQAHSFASLSVPLFIVNGTSNWNLNDTIILYFSLRTACCLPAAHSGETSITIEPSLCTDSTGTGLTVLAPILAPKSVYPGSSHNLIQNTGDAVDFVFQIKNGGTQQINQFVNTVCPIDPSLQMLGYFFSTTQDTTTDLNRNYCDFYKSPNFVAGTYTLISADSSVYDSLFGVHYFPVDSMYLHIVYSVVGCNSSTPDTFELFCSNGTGSATCFPGVGVTTSLIVFAGFPMVNASLTQPSYIDSIRANYCNGGINAINLGLTFINKGHDIAGGAKGNARAEKLRLAFYTSNEIGSMDTSTLKINGYHYAWPTGFVTSVPDIGYTKWKIDFTKWNWTCGNPLPFGPNSVADLNGDGKLDDLSDSTGQDTIHLTADFKYTTICPASFSNCGATDDQIFWGGAAFQNECNTLDSSEESGNGDGYAYYVQSGGYSQLNLLSGHDVVAGQTSYFQICPEANLQQWS
ncbi:MAG TPA: hypothetical protein VK809_08840, partial [Bacteroidia bacterium]|nr:hypothetical protein [Bacteroidia bacterium]